MRYRPMGSRLTDVLMVFFVLVSLALASTVVYAQDAPDAEAPAVDAPTVDAPAAETPDAGAPAVDTPGTEEPAAGESAIAYPQEGQAVRGTIAVLFRGIPDGGYAMVYVDGRGQQNLRTMTAESSYSLDTFALAEGQHSLTVVVVGPGGRRVGESTVNFEVANARVEEEAEGVPLINWTPEQRLQSGVQRYRVFAESNATIDTGTGGGGKKAPWAKDWQAGPDQGRVVVEMILPSGEEFNATRKNSTLGLGDLSPRFPPDLVRPGNTWRTEMTLTAELVKREPINVLAPMTFTSFEAVTTPAGVERRAAKLESRFPLPEEVARKVAKTMQPFAGTGGAAAGGEAAPPGGGAGGAGGEAPEALDPGPLDFQVTLLIRRLVRDVSMIQGAANLQSSVAEMYLRQRDAGTESEGGTGAASAPGPAASAGGVPGAGATGTEAELPPIKVATGNVIRVMWFDVAAHRMLRSEDTVSIHYEEDVPPDAAGGTPGGGDGAGGEGAAAATVEPVKVTHNLRVVKWLDDTIPPPTESFTAGRGTAHAFDNVEDPSVAQAISGH
jgi:hypothetical protein